MMFDNSFGTLVLHILLNIFLPFFPGLLIIWAIFGKYYKGLNLYYNAWFFGVAFVAFSIFNLQFIYYGVNLTAYVLVLLLAIALFLFRLVKSDMDFFGFIGTLKIENRYIEIKDDFKSKPIIKKTIIVVSLIFVLLSAIVTLFSAIEFPTYFDDSFGNWHTPSIHIYYDGGVKMFGDESEILARGRLGYPIYLATYTALIAKLAGGWNDMYVDLFQILSFLLLLKFITVISYKETKDIFKAILAPTLVVGLPLVYFQAIDGYMDLTCGIYSILSIYFLYEYIKDSKFEDLLFGLTYLFVLSYIKNDGMIVYFTGILFSFIFIVLFFKRLRGLGIYLKNIKNISLLVASFFYFFFPFFFLKSYHNLGWNQAAGEKAGVGAMSIHSEVFKVFPEIFFNEDNYNIILVLLSILLVLFFTRKLYKDPTKLFLLLAFLFIFIVLVAVFLFSENYKYALDQTTINRVFTVAFVILASFVPIILKDEK